jgi:hypothetical protein
MKQTVNTARVTVLYFWKIRRRHLFFAFLHMAIDPQFFRRTRAVHFAKSLGTGRGQTFTPRDADMSRWGVLVTINEDELVAFDKAKIISSWRKKSISEFRVLLDPIASHGSWSKKDPFSYSSIKPAGQVVAITRARISFFKNFLFWKSVPPVTSSLHSSPGLISAIGIGEAPIGLQGTFSYWQSADALKEFAYKGAAHREVIEATERNKWYREELFARFSVREVRGQISN